MPRPRQLRYEDNNAERITVPKEGGEKKIPRARAPRTFSSENRGRPRRRRGDDPSQTPHLPTPADPNATPRSEICRRRGKRKRAREREGERVQEGGTHRALVRKCGRRWRAIGRSPPYRGWEGTRKEGDRRPPKRRWLHPLPPPASSGKVPLDLAGESTRPRVTPVPISPSPSRPKLSQAIDESGDSSKLESRPNSSLRPAPSSGFQNHFPGENEEI